MDLYEMTLLHHCLSHFHWINLGCKDTGLAHHWVFTLQVWYLMVESNRANLLSHQICKVPIYPPGHVTGDYYQCRHEIQSSSNSHGIFLWLPISVLAIPVQLSYNFTLIFLMHTRIDLHRLLHEIYHCDPVETAQHGWISNTNFLEKYG